ncbi:MAG: transglutaminase domain-containing protein [Pseudomonadales bacterium]
MIMLQQAVIYKTRLIFLLCFVVLATSCVSVSRPESATSNVDEILLDEVLSGIAILGRPIAPGEIPDEDILQIDDGMREFLARHVTPYKTKTAKVSNLLRAVLSPGVLGLKYDDSQTKTATGAFQAQRANCLAFSNLFVALAREAGLRAYYQDVLVAPEWELESGSMTLRRHVNVKIKISRQYDQVVDISRAQNNILRLASTKLSDDQAFAQYYNNRSIDYLHLKNYEQSFLYARKGLMLDPKAAFIWSNLGVILSRVNKIEHAEAALLKAVDLNSEEQAALSNLGSMYKAQGDLEAANYYDQMVKRYRAKNPYYLLLAARQAFQSNDYDIAMGMLRKALILKKDEPLLHELKSRTHLALGERMGAIRSLEKAMEVAETVSQQQKYGERLELLQSKDKTSSTDI